MLRILENDKIPCEAWLAKIEAVVPISPPPPPPFKTSHINWASR